MKKTLIAVMLISATWCSQAATTVSGDTVLAKYQDIQVTQEDLERYFTFRLSPDQLATAYASPESIAKSVESIFVIRYLAAQQKQVDEEQMAWQLSFQRELWLSEQAQDNALVKAIADVDWDNYAKEAYLAEPEKFMAAKQVDAAHILVSIQQRTREEAAEIIKELQARVNAGEDFNKLAEEYSDDPSAKKNRGELGVFTADKMVPAFSSAAFAMTKPGSVSAPVESNYGFHLIKLNKIIAPEKKSFKQVKGQIVPVLRANMLAKTREQVLLEARSAEGLVIDREAIAKLSKDKLSKDELSKAKPTKAKPTKAKP